jgi:hypothetical protein
MTMIISGSTGLEFPDGSDQTSAFTGNAAAITSGTLAVARLPTSGINAASITVGTLPAAQLPSSGVNAASITTGVLLQANGGTGTTIGYNGFKNRIINGAMMIDQRNAGASVTPSAGFSTYTLDRWNATYSVGSKFSVQQNAGAVTPPVGFPNYLGVTSLSAYSVPSGQAYSIVQCIEGFNTADLGWGTANAQTVTLSFWVRSSLTGTFGGAIKNSADNRSYPFSYTINSANTWEFETITIAGDTSGTWVGATNGIGLQLLFGLGVGSTFSGTAGAWAGSNFYSATGATSVVGTNGATFYITGVQLEKGSTATSFDYRPYGTELVLCQRYYQEHGYTGLVGQGQNTDRNSGSYVSFPVSMRTTPSTIGKEYEIDIGDIIATFTPLLYTDALGQAIGWRPYRNVSTTITRGDTLAIQANAGTAGGPRHPFNAEL